jgi:hypothetical protein
LCCKDGKIDKKAKAKVCPSKKTGRPTQLQTTSGDGGETRTPKVSGLPTSNPAGIYLHVSPLEEINPAGTLEPQIIENPYSIAGSRLVKSTLEVTSTFKTTSTPTTDTSQPSRRHSDLVASRSSSHLRSLGNSSQKRATWNLNDGISDSDDLPLLENLLTKIMPTKGARSYTKVLSAQISTSSVQSMVDAAVRDEAAVEQRVKRSDILLDSVAFSIDDIMECVEIV